MTAIKSESAGQPTPPETKPEPCPSAPTPDSTTMPPPPPGYPVPTPRSAASAPTPQPTTSAPVPQPTPVQVKYSPPQPLPTTLPKRPLKYRPLLLRRGKWTTEEEAYATKLITEFKAGLLPLTDGTTLRNFLSKLLNCDPMRISKKFVGNNCIGKQVFRRRSLELGRLGSEERRRTALELSELEQRFFDRVATTNRVKPLVPQSNTSSHPCYPSPPHLRRNYDDSDHARPPTPPWLKPPSTYVSKRRKVLPPPPQMQTHLQHVVPLQQPATTVATATARVAPVTVNNAKSDTEKAMEAMVKSTSGTRMEEPLKKSESALEQLARTASAAKFVEEIVNGDSGLGDLQIKGTKLSSLSLQGSFQALMSLDMDSVENLAQLSSTNLLSSEELNKLAESHKKGSAGYKSSSRMESFIKSLSNANMKSDSDARLSSLFQHLQKNSLHDFHDEIIKTESNTNLSKLPPTHHNSVEDFLSLVTSGDIPHQDADMLNVPFQKAMASKLSQHQLLKLASSSKLREMAKGSSLSESLADLAAVCGGSSGNLKKRKKGDGWV